MSSGTLAPPGELVVAWAYPFPQPKRHIDRLSRFCTVMTEIFHTFTMGAPFPKTAHSHGGSGPHLIYDSILGQSEPTTKRSSPSVKPFLHRWPQHVPILYTGTPWLPPLKVAPFHGDVHLHPHIVPWAHPSPHPKRHLDGFSRFCRNRHCDRPTVRQTDRQTTLLSQ